MRVVWKAIDENPGELSGYECAQGLPPLPIEKLAQDRPDAHGFLLDDRNVLQARCSLWWREVPAYPGHRLGAIGHYGAASAEMAKFLLHQAGQKLLDQGCTLAVGPMDGNTWRSYRLITERGEESKFFLEMDHPDEWPSHFEKSGYQPLAGYCSALTTDLNTWDAKTEAVFQRLSQLGVTFRPIDMDNFEAVLREIHALSCVSFRGNFLYSPVSEDEFLARYLPIAPYINSSLTLMAEYEDQLVGFLFTLPDYKRIERGEPLDTLIFKTIGRLPDPAFKGLGRVMFDWVQRCAYEAGYRRIIHAYMHEKNASLALSRRTSRIIRRYALFAKVLTP